MVNMNGQVWVEAIKAYLPEKLKQDLDILIDDTLYGEMDCLIVIDGKEGSGKSYDGRLFGKYISSVTGLNFSVPNIHFNIDDYIKFSESHSKFTINVLDETREALNRRRGMSKFNVRFTNWISENRDKQQFHILILPARHDLESYISMWRMKLLIHKLVGHSKIKDDKGRYKFIRGNFKAYGNNKRLQQVLYNKQKYGHYSYPKIPKYARKIYYHEVFSKEEIRQYKTKKAKERNKKYDDANSPRFTKTECGAVKYSIDKLKLSQRETARNYGVSHKMINMIYKHTSQMEIGKESI